MTDIIYYTDNSLPAELDAVVRRALVKTAEDKRIISVSQKPMRFGDNICVGEIGRSYHSIYKQILTGAMASDADYVAMAEHDCLYPAEHFNWPVPSNENTFHYNANNWLVGWATGHYTRTIDRWPLSTMICRREYLIEAAQERIWMMEHGFEIRHASHYCGEFGIRPLSWAMKRALPRKERKTHDYTKDFPALLDSGVKLKDWNFAVFRTQLPVLDIRHESNFSGHKSHACDAVELPGWGKFAGVRDGR